MRNLLIILVLLVTFLVGCNDRNKLMTGLLNDKKDIERDIKHYEHQAEAFEKLYFLTDGTEKQRYMDSSIYYSVNKLMAAQAKLKSINFSIDSLEKMK